MKTNELEEMKMYPHLTCVKCHKGFWLDSSVPVSSLKKVKIGEDETFVMCPKCEFELLTKGQSNLPKVEGGEWEGILEDIIVEASPDKNGYSDISLLEALLKIEKLVKSEKQKSKEEGFRDGYNAGATETEELIIY